MDSQAPFVLRKATQDDVPQLIRLHRVALRELGGGAYTADQIDSFLLHVPTLDDVLIADRTYFVAEAEGTVVGAGGWSFHLPGYTHTIDARHATSLAERTAVIRAMYTHPDWARRGIGRAILEAAEAEAAAAGYRRIELHALLPGVPLYRACGYTPIGRCQAQLGDGVMLPVVHMHKYVDARPAGKRGRPDPGAGWGRAA